MEKKYIIKLEENEIAYKTVNSNGCPMIGLLHPVPYTEPDLEQVREEAYQKGLSDAWDAARKICLIESEGGLSSNTVCNIFNTEYYRDALRDYTPAEAIEKIRQYEQEKDKRARIEYNCEEIKDVINTTMRECNVSLDEIAAVLEKMKEDAT